MSFLKVWLYSLGIEILGFSSRVGILKVWSLEFKVKVENIRVKIMVCTFVDYGLYLVG